ncbi:MAG: CHASE domain-containing protein, partial [Rhodoferax sp.]|nr:CHASE domain-containing protein [Rhodoferax sp.]
MRSFRAQRTESPSIAVRVRMMLRYFLPWPWFLLQGRAFACALFCCFSGAVGSQVDAPAEGWLVGPQDIALAAIAPWAFALFLGLVWAAIARRHHRASRPGWQWASMRWPLAFSAVSLVLGLSLTWHYVDHLRREIYSNNWFKFQHHSDQLESDIKARFDLTLGALRGFRGAFLASKQIRREEFHELVQSIDLQSEFAGVRGFAFVERIERKDADAYVALQRRQGSPDFRIHGGGDRPDLFVVKYVEPLKDNRAALGFDVGSEPVRREAMERAMQHGVASLSGQVFLIQDGQKRAGWLYSLPIYSSVVPPETESERRRQFRGIVNSPLVVDELLEPVRHSPRGLVAFRLFDGLAGPDKPPLFDSALTASKSGYQEASKRSAQPMFMSERALFVGGRLLQLHTAATPDFERSVDLKAPVRTAFLGSSLSLLVSAVVWLLLFGRAQALWLARSMTAELEREKERADSILAGTNVGTWESNVLTGESHANARWSAMMGFQPHEVKPNSDTFFARQVHPQDREVADKALQACIAGLTERYDCDIRIRCKDGRWIWVRSRAKIMSRTPDGRVEWIGGIHTDITQEKEAQLQLQRSEAILRGSIDVVNEAYVLYDPEDRLILCNDKYRELYATSADLIVPGAQFEHIIRVGAERGQYAQAVGRVEEWVAERMQQHRAGNTTVEQRLDDGRWLRVVERRMPDGHLVGFRMDITELKVALETAQAATSQLAVDRATLQSVLDSAVDVTILGLDLDLTITVFNVGASRMLGYEPAQVLGKRGINRFFDQNQLALMRESLELVLGREPSEIELLNDVAQRAIRSEWTFVRADGTTFIGSLMISPMLDVHGQQVGYLGMAQDITRQKEYEESLQQAMHLAEQSNISKSQFLANMSHEIRTPMNAILGMLRLLHNTPLTDRQRDYAEKTEGAARSLLGLLNDILDFSKVEAGKMQLDPGPFELEHLLADLSVILSSNLGSKNVDVLFDVDPGIAQNLIGDELRLKQILINLAGNAIKFTAQGQVVLEWRLLHRTSQQVKLRIAVRDSGIGIAPENQARIFEGFSQAEASTTRRYGGTGLGLAISRRLVQLMGGELVIASELGKGSSFSFEIELEVAHGQAPAPALTDGDSQPPYRVLLVDDNRVALEIGAALMRSMGWEVLEASDGPQAIAYVRDRLQQGTPRLHAIFVDSDMPEMDGWQVIRHLRSLHADKELPRLLMVSGHSRDSLADRTVREQELLDGFLVKPLTTNVLRRAVSLARATALPLAARNLATAVQRLAGMRILLVEDNLINQQVAQELLAQEGAVVRLAANGQLGLDALTHGHGDFDVVLMDLQMPVMDGLTAARAIRGPLGLTTLPVIAMTANAMASDREACLAAGMNAHVGKPFDLNQLVMVLLSHTHGEPMAAVRPNTVLPSMPVTYPVGQAADVWPDSVDVDAALARMGGNRDLLRRTLLAFVDDAQQVPERAMGLSEAGKNDDARREWHGLKGLSGTLGISSLARLAAQLERQVAAGSRSADLQVATTELQRELARLLPSLQQIAAMLLPAPTLQAEDDGSQPSGAAQHDSSEVVKLL